MNSATKNLENDHVYILRLIDVMEKITGINRPGIGDLETVVNLIKNYADGMHHAKEENLFFPMLAEKGFSLQQGPVAVMLQEHTQGRNFVSGMVEGIRKYKEGDENAVPEIFGNMKGYISLLRNHITKENNILFRMADKVLNESDNHILLNEFSEVEKSKSGEILSDSWIKSIENLEDLYMH
jgi:hemerythrin-like domain-containing protein